MTALRISLHAGSSLTWKLAEIVDRDDTAWVSNTAIDVAQLRVDVVVPKLSGALRNRFYPASMSM